MTTDQVEQQYIAGTVVKAIEILNLLGRKEASASEICAELNVNKSTMHRLLYTLECAGYIEKDEVSRMYRVGIKLVELCSLRLNDVELKTEAKPYLRDLVEAINQAVHLGIYSSGQAIFIDKIDVVASIRMYSAIGKAIPVYASAIGKALILDKSDDEILNILDKYGMRKLTPFTLLTPESYMAQIHEARVKGYTVDNGEHEETVCCLAVPIYDYRSEIIAAISTATHKSKDVEQEEVIFKMKYAAKCISRRLGYIGKSKQ